MKRKNCNVSAPVRTVTKKRKLVEELASEDDKPPSLLRSSGNKKSYLQLELSYQTTNKKEYLSQPRISRQGYMSPVSDRDWNDWHWQMRNRFLRIEQLKDYLDLSSAELNFDRLPAQSLPISITPYYLSMILNSSSSEQLRRSVIPSQMEFVRTAGESDDPLSEDEMSPVPGLVHRYPDRVLFLLTGTCSVYCRYCTRSRLVGHGRISSNSRNWDAAVEYIQNHKEIRDVVLSGGDPLTLPDEKLESILSRLRKISHVEIIRIGSKTPAALPQRITPQLVGLLKKYHPLWLSLHFTHPDEITPETSLALNRLADAGFPMGSQTVLLKGVNDEVQTLKDLMHRLMQNRVRPYYLYQCDPISGSSHFRTTVQRGIEIIDQLRGFTSGYAVPTYVIDAPGGGGKIPIQPDYLKLLSDEKAVLRNYEGKTYSYPNPDHSLPIEIS